MKSIAQLQEKHPHLAIHQVVDFEQRIKNGETKRSIEKLEVRAQLKKLGFDSEVLYKDSGQPFLADYPHLFLSISHSKSWFAVCVDKQAKGLDIEVDNPRIMAGSAYFVNENEQQFLSDLKALHLLWGAKEAFYKYMEGQIPDLKNEVTLLAIKPQHLLLSFQEKTFELDYLQEENLTFVIL